MTQEEEQAIQRAADHICALLNSSLGPLFSRPLTAEDVIRMLEHAPPLPDTHAQDTSLGTIRGLMQRMYYVQQALQGKPGKVWLRWWTRKETA